MAELQSRIRKRYEMTKKNWKSDCKFSKKLACLRLLDDIGGRVGFHKLSSWAHSQKEEWILNYLQRMLDPVIQKYKKYDHNGISEENAPIWVCWWDGEENAPLLVRQCIKSIMKNSGEHPVNIVSEKNYSEYLDISEYILNKMKTQKMGLAHFSDYLRVCLLERYGGLWLDATIFCSQMIPQECFSLPFFTCKSEVKKGRYLSEFQWVTFCLGGWKHQVFYQFMKEAFELYWRMENVAIDYLFFDDLIYIAKENIPSIRKLLEAVPINNIHRDDLQAAMNEVLPATEFWNVIKDDTALYKLSWRETYSESLSDGKQSIYGYFINRIEWENTNDT